MMRSLALLLVLAVPTMAESAPAPCLLRAADLRVVLGAGFAEGVVERDAAGKTHCSYAWKSDANRRVWLNVQDDITPKRFETMKRVAAMGTGKLQELPGVGDTAYFTQANAGVLAGTRSVQISGLRAAATRVVQADEAAQLLRIALERAR